MPSLEERESLESTQQQVIDLWFGFDGTRFVVESGLNFREIGERLRITADEARTFYEDAMVFLFIIVAIVSAVVGWGLIEGVIWLFSHITIGWI